jgi:hypothetical protein
MKKELYIASRIHRRENLPQKCPGKSEQNRKSATSSALSKDHLQQARSRGSVYLENSVVHLSDEKMDTYHKEKGSEQGKGLSNCSFGASILKGERKEARHSGSSILPRRPLHRESGVAPRLRR